MPRKGRKKKKKQTEPLLEPEEERRIFNEKLQLAEKELEKVHELNAEKEKEFATAFNDYNQLETDRNDVIEHLQRVLDQTLQRLAGLQEELQILLKEKEEQDQLHAEVNAKMNLEYKLMKESLDSEIQMLEGKLSGMEEFRCQRDELIKKFNIQEEELRKQEEKHKQEIYDLEKKLIKARYEIKLGIDKTVAELDQELEDSSKIRIAAATNTIVKTNIQLNKEMKIRMNLVTKLNLENTHLKHVDFEMRMLMTMMENQISIYEKNNAKKIVQTDKLTGEINEMTIETIELQRQNKLNERKKKIDEANRKLFKEEKMQMQETTKKLKAMNEANGETVHVINSTWTKYKFSKNIIKKAKSLVENFIEFETNKKRFEDEKFQGNFLFNLLEILLTAKNIPGADKISEMSTESIYHPGSLGLISERFGGEGKPYSVSTSKFTPSFVTKTELSEMGEGMFRSCSLMDQASSSSTWVLASSGTVPISDLTESSASRESLGDDEEEEDEEAAPRKALPTVKEVPEEVEPLEQEELEEEEEEEEEEVEEFEEEQEDSESEDEINADYDL